MLRQKILRPCGRLLSNRRFLSTTAVLDEEDTPFVRPVTTYTYPGARVIELSSLETRNELTLDVLSKIARNFKYYTNNIAVSAIMVSSRIHPDLVDENDFSVGLAVTPGSEEYNIVEQAQTLAKAVYDHKTITMVAYEGFTSGTAYGLFAGSKYRLATSDTMVKLTELTQGLLPIGGLAYHFCRASDEGLAFARYIGFSQKCLESAELYSLGLASHIVPLECHTTLFYALGHTVPREDVSKRVQSEQVTRGSLIHLLDTMHAGADLTMDFDDPETWNDYGFNKEEDKWDIGVMESKIWDRGLLVPPSMLPDDELPPAHDDIHGTSSCLSYCSLCIVSYPWLSVEIGGKVVEVFSAPSLAEAVKRLEALQKEQWAQETLASLQLLDPFIAEAWYKLTQLASTASYPRVLELELAASKVSAPSLVSLM